MLYIIGLGLGDEKDITLKGLEAIQKCEKVYMEAYTSLLSFGLSSHGLSNLEKLYGKPIILADREMVEEKADDFLSQAQLSHVAFLVVGDPFGYECLLLLLFCFNNCIVLLQFLILFVFFTGLQLILILLLELRKWELRSKLCTMHLL
jgi:precorrin-6B methylase 1